jgi:hypothetical protein
MYICSAGRTISTCECHEIEDSDTVSYRGARASFRTACPGKALVPNLLEHLVYEILPSTRDVSTSLEEYQGRLYSIQYHHALRTNRKPTKSALLIHSEKPTVKRSSMIERTDPRILLTRSLVVWILPLEIQPERLTQSAEESSTTVFNYY